MTLYDSVPLADLVAPAWFLLCWLGYALYADRQAGRLSLMRSMHAYRRLWMRRMLARENRMVDIQIIGNLMRSVSFFASTSMFIIAGLIAVIGAREQAIGILHQLPFAVKASPLVDTLKILLLAIVFVYAFFKFTWAFRHYNYCLILVGSAPAYDRVSHEAYQTADRAARIASSTAKHFNRGIRAYYFGLAGLSWFLHPWLFVAATVWVVLVVYRREFHSQLLQRLGLPVVPDEGQPPA